MDNIVTLSGAKLHLTGSIKESERSDINYRLVREKFKYCSLKGFHELNDAVFLSRGQCSNLQTTQEEFSQCSWQRSFEGVSVSPHKLKMDPRKQSSSAPRSIIWESQVPSLSPPTNWIRLTKNNIDNKCKFLSLKTSRPFSRQKNTISKVNKSQNKPSRFSKHGANSGAETVCDKTLDKKVDYHSLDAITRAIALQDVLPDMKSPETIQEKSSTLAIDLRHQGPGAPKVCEFRNWPFSIVKKKAHLRCLSVDRGTTPKKRRPITSTKQSTRNDQLELERRKSPSCDYSVSKRLTWVPGKGMQQTSPRRVGYVKKSDRGAQSSGLRPVGGVNDKECLRENCVVHNWHDMSEQISQSLARLEHSVDAPLVATKGVIFVESVKEGEHNRQASIQTDEQLLQTPTKSKRNYKLYLETDCADPKILAKHKQASKMKRAADSKYVKETDTPLTMVVFENESLNVKDAEKTKTFEYISASSENEKRQSKSRQIEDIIEHIKDRLERHPDKDIKGKDNPPEINEEQDCHYARNEINTNDVTLVKKETFNPSDEISDTGVESVVSAELGTQFTENPNIQQVGHVGSCGLVWELRVVKEAKSVTVQTDLRDESPGIKVLAEEGHELDHDDLGDESPGNKVPAEEGHDLNHDDLPTRTTSVSDPYISCSSVLISTTYRTSEDTFETASSELQLENTPTSEPVNEMSSMSEGTVLGDSEGIGKLVPTKYWAENFKKFTHLSRKDISNGDIAGMETLSQEIISDETSLGTGTSLEKAINKSNISGEFRDGVPQLTANYLTNSEQKSCAIIIEEAENGESEQLEITPDMSKSDSLPQPVTGLVIKSNDLNYDQETPLMNEPEIYDVFENEESHTSYSLSPDGSVGNRNNRGICYESNCGVDNTVASQCKVYISNKKLYSDEKNRFNQEVFEKKYNISLSAAERTEIPSASLIKEISTLQIEETTGELTGLSRKRTDSCVNQPLNLLKVSSGGSLPTTRSDGARIQQLRGYVHVLATPHSCQTTEGNTVEPNQPIEVVDTNFKVPQCAQKNNEQLKERLLRGVTYDSDLCQDRSYDDLDFPSSNFKEFEKELKLVAASLRVSTRQRETLEVRTTDVDVQARDLLLKQSVQKITTSLRRNAEWDIPIDPKLVHRSGVRDTIRATTQAILEKSTVCKSCDADYKFREHFTPGVIETLPNYDSNVQENATKLSSIGTRGPEIHLFPLNKVGDPKPQNSTQEIKDTGCFSSTHKDPSGLSLNGIFPRRDLIQEKGSNTISETHTIIYSPGSTAQNSPKPDKKSDVFEKNDVQKEMSVPAAVPQEMDQLFPGARCGPLRDCNLICLNATNRKSTVSQDEYLSTSKPSLPSNSSLTNVSQLSSSICSLAASCHADANTSDKAQDIIQSARTLPNLQLSKKTCGTYPIKTNKCNETLHENSQPVAKAVDNLFCIKSGECIEFENPESNTSVIVQNGGVPNKDVGSKLETSDQNSGEQCQNTLDNPFPHKHKVNTLSRCAVHEANVKRCYALSGTGILDSSNASGGQVRKAIVDEYNASMVSSSSSISLNDFSQLSSSICSLASNCQTEHSNPDKELSSLSILANDLQQNDNTKCKNMNEPMSQVHPSHRSGPRGEFKKADTISELTERITNAMLQNRSVKSKPCFDKSKTNGAAFTIQDTKEFWRRLCDTNTQLPNKKQLVCDEPSHAKLSLFEEANLSMKSPPKHANLVYPQRPLTTSNNTYMASHCSLPLPNSSFKCDGGDSLSKSCIPVSTSNNTAVSRQHINHGYNSPNAKDLITRDHISSATTMMIGRQNKLISQQRFSSQRSQSQPARRGVHSVYGQRFGPRETDWSNPPSDNVPFVHRGQRDPIIPAASGVSSPNYSADLSVDSLNTHIPNPGQLSTPHGTTCPFAYTHRGGAKQGSCSCSYRKVPFSIPALKCTRYSPLLSSPSSSSRHCPAAARHQSEYGYQSQSHTAPYLVTCHNSPTPSNQLPLLPTPLPRPPSPLVLPPPYPSPFPPPLPSSDLITQQYPPHRSSLSSCIQTPPRIASPPTTIRHTQGTPPPQTSTTLRQSTVPAQTSTTSWQGVSSQQPLSTVWLTAPPAPPPSSPQLSPILLRVTPPPHSSPIQAPGATPPTSPIPPPTSQSQPISLQVIPLAQSSQLLWEGLGVVFSQPHIAVSVSTFINTPIAAPIATVAYSSPEHHAVQFSQPTGQQIWVQPGCVPQVSPPLTTSVIAQPVHPSMGCPVSVCYTDNSNQYLLRQGSPNLNSTL